MNEVVSAQELDQFREQGYFVCRGLLSSEKVANTCANLLRLLREADEDLNHPTPGMIINYEANFSYRGKALEERDLGIRKYQGYAERDPFFWELARHHRIVEIATALVGADPRLAQSMALVKGPRNGIAKPWHQDVAYFPVEPNDEMIGFWIALDDATEENGCMQVIPGTHKNGLQPHVGRPDLQLPAQVIEPRRDQILKLPMSTGSALVFDSNLYHYTDHNRTDLRRRALQYHYVSRRTCYTEDSFGREVFSLDAEHPPLLQRASAG